MRSRSRSCTCRVGVMWAGKREWPFLGDRPLLRVRAKGR
jgi:hypothetical protein